ncbi:MAG: IclR family transcriptional regulator [Bacilli bacterium]
MAEYIIPNLKNACKILEFLGHSARALTCLEISRALSLPRTSVMRIMETLASERFVKKEDGKYSIGIALANLGDSSLAQMNLLNFVEPYLAKLTDITGETSHLGVLSGNKVLIAKVCESPFLCMRLRAQVRWLTCIVQGRKVLLAWLSKTIRRFKKNPLRAPHREYYHKGKPQKELSLILRRGYVIDNEEYHAGVRCWRSLFTTSWRGRRSFGITPAVRFDRRSNARMFEIVNAVALELSKRLGLMGFDNMNQKASYFTLGFLIGGLCATLALSCWIHSGGNSHRKVLKLAHGLETTILSI